MSDVARELRRSLLDRLAALTPEESLRLTERLAMDDLELYCAVRGVDADTARRVLQRQRQAGRRISRVALSFFE